MRWVGRRALVTGAAGFLGAHVTRALVAAGARVTALVRPTTDPWRLAPLRDDLELVHADARALGDASLSHRLGRHDVVYHLAAAGVDQRQQDAAAIVDVNVGGTTAALEHASRAGVGRFVYCGSCFEYGEGTAAREDRLPHPLNEYAASKSAGWLLAHAHGRRTGLDVVTLRPFTVYGPLEAPQRLVPFVIGRALAGGRIELTGGRQTRDWVHADDAAEAFLRAGEVDGVAGSTFNVCTGVETSVRALVELVVALTGERATPEFGARPYREPEIWSLSGDPTAAADRLGWTATTSLREGLARTIAEFQNSNRAFPERVRA